MEKPDDVNASCASPCSHPIQPIVTDEHGTKRFKENAIVRYLLDAGGIDMNALARMPFTGEDREQFAQLIGYSVSGFCDLSYASDDVVDAASKMAEYGLTEERARMETLNEKLVATRAALRNLVPKLFRIHPDDLVV
jgi:hypothetical protein